MARRGKHRLASSPPVLILIRYNRTFIRLRDAILSPAVRNHEPKLEERIVGTSQCPAKDGRGAQIGQPLQDLRIVLPPLPKPPDARHCGSRARALPSSPQGAHPSHLRA